MRGFRLCNLFPTSNIDRHLFYKEVNEQMKVLKEEQKQCDTKRQNRFSKNICQLIALDTNIARKPTNGNQETTEG